MKHWIVIAIVSLGAMSEAVGAETTPRDGAARVVTWQPLMAREFELGYQRHLEWHRTHRDPWTWHGWSIITGPQTGYFVDGTFFHRWSEFDSPIEPAGDAADNELNVHPYARLDNVCAYEMVDGIDDFPSQMTSAFMTFAYLTVTPGRASEFESALTEFASRTSAAKFGAMRPIAGANEYLLLIPGNAQSDLPNQASLLKALLAAVNQSASIVTASKHHTARYRTEMSYVP